MQFILFIKNKSDASVIKKKDVKTNDDGEYSTTDNITVLSAACLSNFFKILCTLYYIKESNTTNIVCYYLSSYVDHKSLDEYINNKSDDTTVFVFQNKVFIATDIRLYYI